LYVYCEKKRCKEEINMKSYENIEFSAEWFKGHDLANRTIEGPNTAEESLVSQVNTTFHSERADHDIASDEREAKLELWMEDVKAFIRNIDVNNL